MRWVRQRLLWFIGLILLAACQATVQQQETAVLPTLPPALEPTATPIVESVAEETAVSTATSAAVVEPTATVAPITPEAIPPTPTVDTKPVLVEFFSVY